MKKQKKVIMIFYCLFIFYFSFYFLSKLWSENGDALKTLARVYWFQVKFNILLTFSKYYKKKLKSR